MAKKKGSMSLKDFHGGEIRSDLPLPSKPGVGTEPANKSSFGTDRSFSDPSRDRFVPAYGRGPSARAPPPSDRGYFQDSSSIGKNYEEDERKPVGGGAKNARGPEGLGPFSGGAPAYPSHLVTERFPPSGGGYTSRLADLPSTPPPPQNSPPSEAQQRPKLQLQPRSRPLDADGGDDVSITPGAQVLTIERNVLKEAEPKQQLQGGRELSERSEGGEDEERPKERPRLNLKPRSQEARVGQEAEHGRPGVFGGARPRDVVLKERGVDEAVIIGIEDKRALDSPKKEAQGARLGSPDKPKWGRLGDEPREDRYSKADAPWRPGGKDLDPRENGPSRNGWKDGSEKPGGGFRAEGGFERQGSGGFARSGSFGDNNRGGSQWRQPKPASPPIRSALIDASAKRDPWEAPLTSLQLAEAFSRSTSLGSPGQGRGPGGALRGSPNGVPFGGGSPGRGGDRPGSYGRGPGGAFTLAGRGPGLDGLGSPGGASFGRPGSREEYGRGENGYNRGAPRSQVYQDDERGELVLPGKRPQRKEEIYGSRY